MNETVIKGIFALLIMGFVVTGAGGAMYGCPRYHVWQQQKAGEAELARAEVNRKILVHEAEAQEEALMLVASGEAEREKIKADATAYAIEQVGAKLSAHPEYMRHHWINEVAGSDNEKIYIATEAGLPILEARTPQIPIPQ